MKFKLLILLSLFCLTLQAKKEAYLFSYFIGNGEDGLHLAYSYDGLKWEALNNGQSYLKPEIGKDKLMRDPSIVQSPDGTFHMVWTSGWWDNIIGYASSKDLIRWSAQQTLPVMTHEPTARNAWAPELYFDKKNKTYYIVWATTIPGRFTPIADSEREKGLNHRLFCTTTRDFKSFTPTALFFNPDFSAIDGAILKKGREHWMFVKNENPNPPQKNIRIAKTTDMTKGFPTEVSEPITGKYWAEGPTPLKVGKYIYVYFDKYTEHKYGAVRSLDGKTWEDVSHLISMPKGIRHGTAFRVKESVLNNLLGIKKKDNTVAATAKPWAFWWWPGSAVTEEGIRKNLSDYHKAGFGGMHIIPIYGVKGFEKQAIPYLSSEWVRMLGFTVKEAAKYDMGIDMTLGTGWPFGGKGVTAEDNPGRISAKRIALAPNQTFSQQVLSDSTLKFSKLQCALFYSGDAKATDISAKIDSKGFLTFTNNKPGEIILLYAAPTLQSVKRAAPGGEGLVIDYFSKKALNNYLQRFDSALTISPKQKAGVRAVYNDSYEVFNANWTAGFFDEFSKRRGYDFRPYSHILSNTKALSDTGRCVAADYYQTISDLVCDNFSKPLSDWSKKQRKLVRNQSHGSPGNWLDLYELADIPETEYFGAKPFDIPNYRMDPDYEKSRFGTPEQVILKFASSAANTSGKKLVSSESTTWLGNHFKVSLSQIKPVIDELFVSGINHLFFHGVTYSEPKEAWPGWLFYASTNYNQQSHFFETLPELNKYITTCQQELQTAKSDNDILLYFPLSDYWQNLKTINSNPMLTVHDASWIENTNFGKLAKSLKKQGYCFDFISDKQLTQCQVTDLQMVLSKGNSRYSVIVIPETKYMPLSTLQQLSRLANAGAKIVFDKGLPDMPCGLTTSENTEKFNQLKQTISGKISIARDIDFTLRQKNIRREEMSAQQLDFIRKKTDSGYLYFISNMHSQFSTGKIILPVFANAVECIDPVHDRSGRIPFQKAGATEIEVKLQILPGESLILKTYSIESDCKTEQELIGFDSKKQPTILKGKWDITFTEGAPALPKPFTCDTLASWTNFGDSTNQWFSGKARYSLKFKTPSTLRAGKACYIDLGDVRESAEVLLNGVNLGKTWSLPFRVYVPAGILKKENKIEVIVTNLSANRIRKMDQDKVNWKKFYDINIVDINYKPFNAAGWKPQPSGLLGPVSMGAMEE